ncbi:MAG: porin family protein [Methylocystis sp.]
MKRLTVSAIALAMGMGSALAADLPYRKAPIVAPPPPPPLVWTGFYAGLNIGGGWENNNNNQYNAYWDPNYPFGGTISGTPNLFFLPNGYNNQNGSNGGVIGGAQIGYNYQFNQSIVIGLETDFQGTSFGNNNNNGNYTFYPSPYPNSVTGAFNNFLVPVGGGYNWNNQGLANIGTVRGRIGWLITPSLLIYGTGGFAYAGSWFFNNINVGWTAGGGVEWMFAPNWSAKVEYLYAQFSTDNNYNNGSGYGWGGGSYYNSNQSVNIVRVGVNYHFNWAQPAPVLAKF